MPLKLHGSKAKWHLKTFSKFASFEVKKLNILVDYLTVSVRKMSLEKLLEILKLSNEKMETGYSRWLGNRLYLGGISIHYGEYIILEMSGHGCRFLESLYDNKLNWIDFIDLFLCLEGSHIARLDIACDDKPEDGGKGILSFPTMARHCIQRRYISRSTHKPFLQQLGEESIYFGSPKSDRRLRIYNKAMERGVPDSHWIRAEFQLRNESALSFYMRALELGSIGLAYQGMLFDFLRFTKEKNQIDDKNQSRMTVTRWWRTFCGNAKKIKGFYVGGLEYNLESLERYLNNQTSSSMKTWLTAHGGDVTELVKIAQGATYNKKQDFLLKSQPLIEQMYEDYAPDICLKNTKPALTPKESLMIAMAHTEQSKRVDRVNNWTQFGCGSLAEQKAWENSQKIMEELAKNDLPFD